jgi:hypothetical protein
MMILILISTLIYHDVIFNNLSKREMEYFG